MGDTSYQEKDFGDEEIWAKCETLEQFEDWCIDGFWEDPEDFESDTGITFEDIEGRWFQFVHDRVYIKTD